MKKIEAGMSAPDFELPATGNRTITLAALRGLNVVLYFYPKDNTPGCVREGQEFRNHYAAFQALDTEILGVSRDDLQSHETFKKNQRLPFPLLADTEETVCRAFGVIKMKKMYRKEVRGIERSTFLLDKSGVVREIWRQVKVDGHVSEVLQALKALQ